MDRLSISMYTSLDPNISQFPPLPLSGWTFKVEASWHLKGTHFPPMNPWVQWPKRAANLKGNESCWRGTFFHWTIIIGRKGNESYWRYMHFSLVTMGAMEGYRGPPTWKPEIFTHFTHKNRHQKGITLGGPLPRCHPENPLTLGHRVKRCPVSGANQATLRADHRTDPKRLRCLGWFNHVQWSNIAGWKMNGPGLKILRCSSYEKWGYSSQLC